ncbi:MAG: HAD family hydrolase [Planctomycetes bacterium]|nr:HAD family hydrolase [Planctomycetota bacterium]
MSVTDFPFEAVLFDLDGTLVATDRFWVPAARVGAKRAFAELGLEREIPTPEEWMGLVGLPLAEGFDALFEDLSPEQRKVILDRCVEEEHFALDAGRAALLPGALEVLQELRRRGVRTGSASICSQRYLAAAMEGMGLGEWVEEGRCLESHGIGNKADMLSDLLITFDTRSAVMVGDRQGDFLAAEANSLPFVLCENGFRQDWEQFECEGRISDLLELIPLLEAGVK